MKATGTVEKGSYIGYRACRRTNVDLGILAKILVRAQMPVATKIPLTPVLLLPKGNSCYGDKIGQDADGLTASKSSYLGKTACEIILGGVTIGDDSLLPWT